MAVSVRPKAFALTGADPVLVPEDSDAWSAFVPPDGFDLSSVTRDGCEVLILFRKKERGKRGGEGG